MNRQEEIVKQAVKEQSQLYQQPEWRAGFISGANWADKTMLDRACEWLSIYYPNIDRMGIDEFITAFRQAMKGGAE